MLTGRHDQPPLTGWARQAVTPPVIDFQPLSRGRWIVLCTSAEAIGMTAAATAAKVAHSLVREPSGTGQRWLGLMLVVAGGLVEGVALGGLQAAGLRRLLPGLDRHRWVLLTTAVAGLGWAVASAPAALSGNESDSAASPPALLMLSGAAALGATMGAVLGAAQASALRGLVSRPARWTTANVAAWAPAMVVIFAGAGAPAADWRVAAVAGLGTLTGAMAGAVLGLVTGLFLPALAGRPARS